jgi:hypothetical protein
VLRLLQWFHIAPYRCGVCRYKFTRPDVEAEPLDRTGGDGSVFQTFLVPDDCRGLDEVIRDIGRDEHEQRSDTGGQKS